VIVVEENGERSGVRLRKEKMGSGAEVTLFRVTNRGSADAGDAREEIKDKVADAMRIGKNYGLPRIRSSRKLSPKGA
jgi:hypothetical protein